MDCAVTFAAALWVYPGKSAWFFVTLPSDASAHIRFFSANQRRNWGSVRVRARIGETVWQTSVFPQSQTDTYLLPVRAAIRKREAITAGDMVRVSLNIGV